MFRGNGSHDADDCLDQVTPRVAAIVLLEFGKPARRYEQRYQRTLSPEQRRAILKALDRIIDRERTVAE